MLRRSIAIVSVFVVVALFATTRMWSTDVELDSGMSMAAMQQRMWQLRWVVNRPRGLARAVDRPPPSPPKSGQAPEARRAVEAALTQLIPSKGDGRRGGFDDQRNVKRESDTVRHMLRQDGLMEWRPDASQLPTQLHAGASMAELLRAVPINGTAWLAFGNAGVTEMLMNWVC